MAQLRWQHLAILHEPLPHKEFRMTILRRSLVTCQRKFAKASKKKLASSGSISEDKIPIQSEAVSTALLPKELEECTRIIQTLAKHDYAGPFLEPVDPIRLNVPDYFKIIKHPMDFGTIQDKLKKGVYRDTSDFTFDVKLVFSNAMTYNAVGSDVYLMAQTLSSVFKRLCQTATVSIGHRGRHAKRRATKTEKRKKSDDYQYGSSESDDSLGLASPPEPSIVSSSVTSTGLPALRIKLQRSQSRRRDESDESMESDMSEESEESESESEESEEERESAFDISSPEIQSHTEEQPTQQQIVQKHDPMEEDHEEEVDILEGEREESYAADTIIEPDPNPHNEDDVTPT